MPATPKRTVADAARGLNVVQALLVPAATVVLVLVERLLAR
jgi:hypothetical protein